MVRARPASRTHPRYRLFDTPNAVNDAIGELIPRNLGSRVKVECPHCGTTVLRTSDRCPSCRSRFDDPVTAASRWLRQKRERETSARREAGDRRFSSKRLTRGVVIVFVLMVAAVGVGLALPWDAAAPLGLIIAVVAMGLGLRVLYVLVLAVEHDDRRGR